MKSKLEEKGKEIMRAALETEYQDYLKRVYAPNNDEPPELTPQQEKTLRSVFYAGVWALVRIQNDINVKSAVEKILVEQGKIKMINGEPVALLEEMDPRYEMVKVGLSIPRLWGD